MAASPPVHRTAPVTGENHPGTTQVTSSAQTAPQPSWQMQCQGPTKPHTHLSLNRELPVLGEAEGKAAENPRNQRTVSSHAGLFCQPTIFLYHHVLSPAELPTHRSSHLIWTQPGLRRKDQGWYHFSTVGRLEQSTSSHRCRTCSLRTSKKDDARAWRTPTCNPFPGTPEHPLSKGPESLRTSLTHWLCPVGYPLKVRPLHLLEAHADK